MVQFAVPQNTQTNNKKDELDWENIEPDTLPKDLAAKYTKLRQIIDALAEAKDDFENTFSAAVVCDAGNKMVFSYRYGLACAQAPIKKAGKGKVNFNSLAKPKGK